MQRKDWKYNSSVEKRLAEALISLTRPVDAIAHSATSYQDLRGKILKISKTPEWREFSWNESVKMVKGITTQNSRTWREAAKNSRRSKEIHTILRGELYHHTGFIQLIRENSKIITSLPVKLAEEITERASTRFMEGMRSDQILKEIKAAAPGMAISKAQLIARTETAKAQAAVTQIRSEELGINWYVWRTSEDQRVRSSHKHMDAVLCRYDNPPSPEVLIGMKSQGHYGPGEIYNCRCYAEPVIDAQYLRFPMNVYYAGRIQKMTKRQWLEITQGN